MRTDDTYLRAGVGRALIVGCAVAVTLTIILTLLVGGPGPIGGADLLLAVSVVAALTSALLSTARPAAPVPRVQTAASGASGHVEAATAYWCALAAPRRPQRPRAPGRS